MLCSVVTLPPRPHPSSNTRVSSPESHQSSRSRFVWVNCDRSPWPPQLALVTRNPGALLWGGIRPGSPRGVCVYILLRGSCPTRASGTETQSGQDQVSHRVHLEAAPPRRVGVCPPAAEGAAPGSAAPGGQPRAVPLPELPAALARHPAAPAPRLFLSLS